MKKILILSLLFSGLTFGEVKGNINLQVGKGAPWMVLPQYGSSRNMFFYNYGKYLGSDQVNGVLVTAKCTSGNESRKIALTASKTFFAIWEKTSDDQCSFDVEPADFKSLENFEVK